VNLVFADTSYWLAVLSKEDQFHKLSARFNLESLDLRIVTTELVITEVFNHLCKSARLRMLASQWAKQLYANESLSIISLARIDLHKAIDFYAARHDKSWSLVDCSSFILMQQFGITNCLTTDHHFEQAGFVNLLR
jgi:uncharacterized protein